MSENNEQITFERRVRIRRMGDRRKMTRRSKEQRRTTVEELRRAFESGVMDVASAQNNVRDWPSVDHGSERRAGERRANDRRTGDRRKGERRLVPFVYGPQALSGMDAG